MRSPTIAAMANTKTETKVVRLQRGFLGMGERRAMEKEINKMTGKGWTYVETQKKWGGYDLLFTREKK